MLKPAIPPDEAKRLALLQACSRSKLSNIFLAEAAGRLIGIGLSVRGCSVRQERAHVRDGVALRRWKESRSPTGRA